MWTDEKRREVLKRAGEIGLLSGSRRFKVGDCRESRDIGVVWPVLEDHGKCGCGACDLVSPVAFFVDRRDADRWASERNTRGAN
jgi:hypothetical protein